MMNSLDYIAALLAIVCILAIGVRYTIYYLETHLPNVPKGHAEWYDESEDL